MPRKSKGANERRREDSARQDRAATTSVRDIGPPPKVANQQRRDECERDLLKFCKTYLPERFPLPFSDDHKRVISRLQDCILTGGQYALAMPRGSGKTTLCEAASLWGIIYGHRRFLVLIGASQELAESMLASIKVELETNDDLFADFPEVTWPVRKLERIGNRASGQISCGNPTYIGWATDSVTIPTIEGSKASGAKIEVRGITGSIRGMKHTTTDGEVLRPDVVIIDDPQTDESAASASQNNTRERVLAKAVLGLAGPKKKIAAVMPCTVIQPGDMAARMLDRKRNPEWNGETCKMLYSFPTDMKLWEEYNRIRVQGLRSGDGIGAATAFYAKNREAMDAGAKVAWEAVYLPDEISAVQHAMNLYFIDPNAFASERQNEPLAEARGEDFRQLVADEIMDRVNNLPVRVVPSDATRVTAFIDVQGNMLFYCVVAWDEQFNGSVIDYGTWPRQKRAYFRKSDADPTFETDEKYAGMALERAIYKALADLTVDILGRTYTRMGVGDDVSISACLVDTGFNKATVLQFIRQSQFRAILYPSKGIGIGAGDAPMDEWPKKPGEIKHTGQGWVIRPPAAGEGVRSVLIDTNHMKTFVALRLQTPFGSSGCLSLFGTKAIEHQLFADHCTAEIARETANKRRKLVEWKDKPAKPDNDWWDCLVGCAAGAGILGLRWNSSGEPERPVEPRQKLRYADVIAARERANREQEQEAGRLHFSESASVDAELNEAITKQPTHTPTSPPKKKLRYADVIREREQRRREGQ